MREVGAALDRFRAAGKPVIVWAVNLDQGQYYLAAHADRLLVDPQGGVMLTGLANYRLFYKDLLDKLGVDVHLFRVGEFKSAAEPYILDHASAEAKQADSYWMGGLWDGYLDEVAGLRKLDPAALRDDIDNLPQHIASTQGNLAQLALNQHLVDGLATRAELIAMMRREGVPADRKGHSFRQVDLDRYAASVSRDSDALGSGRGDRGGRRRDHRRQARARFDRRRIHRGADPQRARGPQDQGAGAAGELARRRGVRGRADPPRDRTDPQRPASRWWCRWATWRPAAATGSR